MATAEGETPVARGAFPPGCCWKDEVLEARLSVDGTFHARGRIAFRSRARQGTSPVQMERIAGTKIQEPFAQQ